MMIRNKSEIKIVWLIFIVSLVIRLTKYVGVYGGDDIGYAKVANELSKGVIRFAQWPTFTRHLITVPTAIFYALFGVNDYSSIMWPLLCYFIEFFIIIKICRRLFPDINITIPALLLAFYPLDMLYSTTLRPDIIISMMFSLAFYLMLLALDNDRLLYYFMTGVIIALGQYVKEYSPLFNLVVILCLVYTKGFKRDLVKPISVLLLGNLIVFSIVEAGSWLISGVFLYRYRMVFPYMVSSTIKWILHGGVHPDELSYFHYFRYMFFSKQFGLYFYLFAISLFFIAAKRLKKIIPLLIWFVIMFIFLEFSFYRLYPHLTTDKQARYLTAITTPVIVIISCFIWAVMKGMIIRKRKKLVAVSILCVLTLTGLCCYVTEPLLKKRKSSYHYRTAQYLKKMPSYPIVLMHPQMKSYFLYHFRYKKKFYIYNEWKKLKANGEPYYVVVNKIYLPGSGNFLILENPEPELKNPPSDWVLLKVFDKNASLYMVNSDYSDNK